MSWRVGRTVLSSAVTVPLASGAYAANDAIGSAFEIPNAIGNEGSLVAQMNVFDRASALSGLRVHFWSRVPPAVADNAAFAIPSGQEAGYLGYIEVESTDWVTAAVTGGNTAYMARIIDQNIGLYNNSGNNRSVWATVQAVQGQTFGEALPGAPLTISLVTLQD